MKTASTTFDQHIRLPYQLYNSLFLTLPFDLIHQTGTLLPLLSALCKKRYTEGASPEMIIREFFDEYLPGADTQKQIAVLFNFIKYIERQVVLFDAIEEAAFDKMYDLNGPGTLHDVFDRIRDEETWQRLHQRLQDFRLRIVLTAHPTQFYPGSVLGIITDLSHALRHNDFAAVSDYLLQLGKTPFINREKPTPLDEARSLTWYLEHVFYDAISTIVAKLSSALAAHHLQLNTQQLITMGFWPGGDRDGNPFVTAEITRQTADRLKQGVLSCYHRDIRELRRKLTFQHVLESIIGIEYRLFDSIHNGPRSYPDAATLLHDLRTVRQVVMDVHEGLFIELLDMFIARVEIFGFHFASLDIRQDSRKHEFLLNTVLRARMPEDAWTTYAQSTEQEKMQTLAGLSWQITPADASDETSTDIIESILIMQEIQRMNGALACERYVISNARSALDVITVLTLVRWTAGSTEHVDIVPLFETIDDLGRAGEIMEALYRDPYYLHHLLRRNVQQTIMLGFSDGTKDGGYLRANWSIFRAKERLTETSRKHNVRVIFFDGRGGPPSRGGGNTHKFYSSLGPTVENKEVQLTIQGQTVSSKYGHRAAAMYNLEQLFCAGIENVFTDPLSGAQHTQALSDEARTLLETMAATSYDCYTQLKERPEFLNYLQDVGTLDYYGGTNIGSRPVKRGQKSQLTLDALRAIPFTGTWSQLKQNVPGYYGLGSAIKALESKAHFEDVQTLYRHSGFFQTLVGNSMQSLSKTFFPLTAYLKDDPEYGAYWNLLHDEYVLTVEQLLNVSGQSELMEDAPDIRNSIRIREEIVLPLLTIQQAALQAIRSGTLTEDDEAVYRKIVLRTMFGIINAGRNVA